MTAPLTGVLLAAGRSRRMGRPKALLPWPGPDGETTIVAAAFDALAARCDRMVVVLAHESGATVEALGERAYARVDGDADAEMLDSVRRGLVAADTDAALHLVDHPRITDATWSVLLEARQREPGRAILPTTEGRGGHPIILPVDVQTAVVGFEGAGGLRALWRVRPELCRRVPVDDPWIRVDLDTPDRYERARRAPS